MQKAILGALSGAIITFAAGSALAAPQVQFVMAAAGNVMADSRGMVLYTYDRDMPGQSTCTGGCLTNWPLFKAAANDAAGGDWTIVTRPDMERVWAYKGKPLYFYAMDTAPRDSKGDNVGMVWHVIKQGM